MPIDHTDTIYEKLESSFDWENIESKADVSITDNDEVILDKYNVSFGLEGSLESPTDTILDDHRGSYSVLVRCVNRFEGNITFYSPNQEVGFRNSGEIVISIISPNGTLTEIKRKNYQSKDRQVEINDIVLNKNFQYIFKQSSATDEFKPITVSSVNWRDFSNQKLFNHFIHTLNTHKTQLSFNFNSKQQYSKNDKVWDPIFDGKNINIVEEEFEDNVLQQTVFPQDKNIRELNSFKQVYNAPILSRYIADSDIDKDKEIGPTNSFDTSDLISFDSLGNTILEDESKNEVLLGLARTRYTTSSDYTQESNNILEEYIKKYSSDDRIVILNNDVEYGYDLQSDLQSIFLNKRIDVLDSSMVFYDESTEYHYNYESKVTKENTTASVDIFTPSVGVQSESLFNKQSSNIDPITSAVLEDGSLITPSFSKTSFSANPLSPTPSYTITPLKQSIQTTPLESLDILSTADIDGKQTINASPLTGTNFTGAILSDGGGNGLQLIETIYKNSSYNVYSFEGIEPFPVDSISDVNFITKSTSYSTPTKANVNPLETKDDLLENYGCVIIQQFGNSDNANEFLNRIPYNDGDKGTLFLDQWGSDSDTFSELQKLRNNPSNVEELFEPSNLYGKIDTEVDSKNTLQKAVENPYKILTIHESNYADSIIASGYSGKKKCTVSAEVKINETCGFSKVEFYQNKKDPIEQGYVNYGYVRNKRFFDIVGNNYIKWDGIDNNETGLTMQASRDSKNWIDADNGESIPTTFKTSKNPTGLYLRAKLSRSLNNNSDYSTPVLNSFEFLIDEASAEVLYSANVNDLTGERITAFETFENYNPLVCEGNINENVIGKVTTSNVTPFEAEPETTRIVSTPLTATYKRKNWKIMNNRSEVKLGEIITAKRKHNELELELSVSNTTLNEVIRPMYANAGKQETITKSNGVPISIDLTGGNNTYKIMPNSLSNPPFIPQEYTLKSYRESTATNKGSKFNIGLSLAPKDPPEEGPIFEQDMINQQRSPNQWSIDFRRGKISTINIDAKVNSDVKDGLKLTTLNLTLTRRQCKAVVSNLIYTGSTQIESPDDGRPYILDASRIESNTISVIPPGDSHELDRGTYVVNSWEIKTTGTNEMYEVQMRIAKE